MKKRRRLKKPFRIIRNIIVSAIVVIIVFIATVAFWFGIILQESYKLNPLTEEEIAMSVEGD